MGSFRVVRTRILRRKGVLTENHSLERLHGGESAPSVYQHLSRLTRVIDMREVFMIEIV